MKRAIRAVRNGELGLKLACRQFNVPRTTLQRRCRKNKSTRVAAKKGLGSRKPCFSIEHENEMVQHVKAMEAMLFGFTPKQLRELAFQFVEINNIEHKFNKANKAAGYDWIRGFMSRHRDISLRVPEATSVARAMSFNRVSVRKFYDILEALYDKYHFTADCIYNVDETGITTVPNRPSRILALRGKKQVGNLTSAERGKLVTSEICMNAAGNFIPPLFIFPRVRMKDELMDNAPPGAIAVPHKSGWMQTEIFTQWFRHFLKHSNPSEERPVLLILDGHKTHTNNLDVIMLARDKNVHIVCLPPHCTHRLQPLDVSFMKPLMTYYTQEVEKWLRNHPGRVITTFQIAGLSTGRKNVEV
ncbi:Uncharacterised protein r2_g3461 [Pycnogonum litorale]